MKFIVFLLLIITVKVLLTKGVMLLFILLSFAVKGKTLHKDKTEWNSYFLRLSENFVIQYAIIIYAIATILSSLVVYALFKLFEFRYPLLYTVALATGGVVLTLCKYLKKGKREITDAVQKIHQNAIPDNDNNQTDYR